MKINNRQDLQFFLQADRYALGRQARIPGINDLIWRFQILLRRVEYYENASPTSVNKLMLKLVQYRKQKLGFLLGFHIPPNVFGPGLRINHFGNIVVNGGARIGMWCDIHQGVNIGSNLSSDGQNQSPTIGTNCWIGPGAKIFGRIRIGNGVVIGANAVVTKDIPDNVTTAGVPARIIKQEGTAALDVAASATRTGRFFATNKQYMQYIDTHSMELK